MKPAEFLQNSIEHINDKYIAEANPDGNEKRFNRKKITASIIAAAACLALVLVNLWLFVPFGP